MNPIERLEAAAKRLERWQDVHGSGYSDINDAAPAELRAIIAEIKKRDEAVRKVAEEMERAHELLKDLPPFDPSVSSFGILSERREWITGLCLPARLREALK